MAITIGAVVMYLEVLNGFTAISNYSETIFRDAGSTLSPAVSTIILGFIILIGAYSSTFLVERAGRRILMVTSTTGCGISLSVVATYSYVKKSGYDVTAYSWAPLIFLSAFMLFASIGVITIHMVIISEILAQKVGYCHFVRDLRFLRFYFSDPKCGDHLFDTGEQCVVLPHGQVLPDPIDDHRNAWLHGGFCNFMFRGRTVYPFHHARNQRSEYRRHC
jgi:Sugar (and other) transporter